MNLLLSVIHIFSTDQPQLFMKSIAIPQHPAEICRLPGAPLIAMDGIYTLHPTALILCPCQFLSVIPLAA
jgi:hypothetical protein